MLDQGYKWDLTDEEAMELGRRAIYAAQHRDAYSGNVSHALFPPPLTLTWTLIVLTLIPRPTQTLNLYTVKEQGWVYHGNLDAADLHYGGPPAGHPASQGSKAGEGYGYEVRTQGLSSKDTQREGEQRPAGETPQPAAVPGGASQGPTTAGTGSGA